MIIRWSLRMSRLNAGSYPEVNSIFGVCSEYEKFKFNEDTHQYMKFE